MHYLIACNYEDNAFGKSHVTHYIKIHNLFKSSCEEHFKDTKLIENIDKI